jgi:hypothetical protein
VWRDEILKVDPKTKKRLFPNLRIMNYYGGGALSTSKTMAEDLPTTSERMQAKLDSFNPLDPRTAEIVVISTFPTTAYRCLDTFLEIGGIEYPLKTKREEILAKGITEDDLAQLGKALETGIVPEGIKATWKTNLKPRTFGFTALDEGYVVAGLRSQQHAVLSKMGG